MKSYRVREKKQTDCVLSDERYETTKNDKIILKCTCVSCGATKIKFIKQGNWRSPDKLGALKEEMG